MLHYALLNHINLLFYSYIPTTAAHCVLFLHYSHCSLRYNLLQMIKWTSFVDKITFWSIHLHYKLRQLEGMHLSLSRSKHAWCITSTPYTSSTPNVWEVLWRKNLMVTMHHNDAVMVQCSVYYSLFPHQFPFWKNVCTSLSIISLTPSTIIIVVSIIMPEFNYNCVQLFPPSIA